MTDVWKTATLSSDSTYRYMLTRRWDVVGPTVAWIMLNPSIADGYIDDRTIGRCMGFARAWGYGGIRVVNLYAYVATKPKVMFAAEAEGADIVGPDNNIHLRRVLREGILNKNPVIAAWGVNAKQDRVDEVLRMAGAERLQCLDVTASGAPGHPLYLRADSNLAPWPISN